jgi:hypothetical protein
MATFVWDPAVQWPPPAHILLNYDVVAPGGAVLSPLPASQMEETRMSQPFLALITPLSGGHPDQGLPSPQPPQPPGVWPGPGYPDQGLPGQPPGIWPSPGHPAHPIAPGGRPPGIWGGAPPYPDQGLPGQPPGVWPSPGYPAHPIAPGGWPGRPDQGLPPVPGVWPGVPTHPWVPPAGEELPPPPEEIASKVVVAVWRPEQQTWAIAVGQGPQPAPNV